MKYKIVKQQRGYIIGSGHKMKFTWQGLGIAYIFIALALAIGVCALIIFLGPKMVPVAFGAMMLLVFTNFGFSDAKRYAEEKFRIFPYKTDRWTEAYHVMYSPGVTVIETLDKLLKNKNTSNFVDKDELARATIATLKLHDVGELKSDDVRQYNEDLGELLDQCEAMSNKQLLGTWEAHDTVLKDALSVAKTVNGEITD